MLEPRAAGKSPGKRTPSLPLTKSPPAAAGASLFGSLDSSTNTQAGKFFLLLVRRKKPEGGKEEELSVVGCRWKRRGAQKHGVRWEAQRHTALAASATVPAEMAGSESCSLATLFHLFMNGRSAARSSSVSSVSFCAILLSDFLNRRQRRMTNGGIEELHFGHTFHLFMNGRGPARSSSVISVSSCKTLLFSLIRRNCG